MGNNASTSQQDRIAYQSFVANYAFLRKVKDPRYGEISILEDKNTREHVALKEILSKSTSDFNREIEELKNRVKISHPNIIRLIAYTSKAEDNLCASFYKILLIIDYIDQDFERELTYKKTNSTFYSEEQLWYILESILTALQCLQNHNVPHGDIKPSNVFVSKLGSYKIAEQTLFGNVMPSYTQRLSGFQDVRSYLSPALLKNLAKQELYPKHDPFKSDIFSLGLSILHAATLTNCDKFFDWDNCTIDLENVYRRVSTLNSRYSDQFQRFVRSMLNANEDQRPSASDLLSRIPNNEKLCTGEPAKAQQALTYKANPYQRKYLQEQPQPQADEVEVNWLEESAKKPTVAQRQHQYAQAVIPDDQNIEQEYAPQQVSAKYINERPQVLRADVQPSPMKSQEEPANDNLKIVDQDTYFPSQVNKSSFAQFNSRVSSATKLQPQVQNVQPRADTFSKAYQPQDEIAQILNEYRNREIVIQAQPVQNETKQASGHSHFVAYPSIDSHTKEVLLPSRSSYTYSAQNQYTTISNRGSVTGLSYKDALPCSNLNAAVTPSNVQEVSQNQTDIPEPSASSLNTSSSNLNYYKPSADIERILQEIKTRTTPVNSASCLTTQAAPSIQAPSGTTYSSYTGQNAYASNSYRSSTSYTSGYNYNSNYQQQTANQDTQPTPASGLEVAKVKSQVENSQSVEYQKPMERYSATLEYNRSTTLITQSQNLNETSFKSSTNFGMSSNTPSYNAYSQFTTLQSQNQNQYTPIEIPARQQPAPQKENTHLRFDEKENLSKTYSNDFSVKDIVSDYRKKDQFDHYNKQVGSFINNQQQQQLQHGVMANPLQPLSQNTQISGVHKRRTSNSLSRNSYNPVEIVTEHYADGSVYEGEKRANFRHGKGKFYYSDGGLYDGDWKAGSMDGFGTLYYAAGQVAYEGEWKEDKFDGKGIVYNEIPMAIGAEFDYTNFDNLGDYWTRYEGGFLDDNKEGFGTLYLTGGDRFEGEFKDDMVHGRGAYIHHNGQTFIGEWWNNRLI